MLCEEMVTQVQFQISFRSWVDHGAAAFRGEQNCCAKHGIAGKSKKSLLVWEYFSKQSLLLISSVLQTVYFFQIFRYHGKGYPNPANLFSDLSSAFLHPYVYSCGLFIWLDSLQSRRCISSAFWVCYAKLREIRESVSVSLQTHLFQGVLYRTCQRVLQHNLSLCCWWCRGVNKIHCYNIINHINKE